jgi:hypothetical protein
VAPRPCFHRQSLKEAVETAYQHKSYAYRGQRLEELDRIIRRMTEGDLVLTPLRGTVYLGEIIAELLWERKQVIFYGPPGTGKSMLALFRRASAPGTGTREDCRRWQHDAFGDVAVGKSVRLCHAGRCAEEPDLERTYDERGRSYVECHHMIPLYGSGERRVSISDPALRCSTCHRMIHAKPPLPAPTELRESIQRQAEGSDD